MEAIKNDPILLSSYRKGILEDFHLFENISIGFFEYDYEDRTFQCWIPGKRIYHLRELLSVIDLEKDEAITTLIKEELFRYPLDGMEDISEKIAFADIATDLIQMRVVKDEYAIRYFISGFIDDIKELVALEYMTRVCSKKCLSILKKNQELVENADGLFLAEVKRMKKKDFLSIIDFLDDFSQVGHIFPLTKSKAKIRELDMHTILNNAQKKLKTEANRKATKIDEPYHDISDKAIDAMMQSIKNG